MLTEHVRHVLGCDRLLDLRQQHCVRQSSHNERHILAVECGIGRIDPDDPLTVAEVCILQEIQKLDARIRLAIFGD